MSRVRDHAPSEPVAKTRQPDVGVMAVIGEHPVPDEAAHPVVAKAVPRGEADESVEGGAAGDAPVFVVGEIGTDAYSEDNLVVEPGADRPYLGRGAETVVVLGAFVEEADSDVRWGAMPRGGTLRLRRKSGDAPIG